MSLIDSPRLRPEDRTAWQTASAQDLAWASTGRHQRLVEEAERTIVRFTAAGDGYAGVSWGKDSTVLADLVARVAPTVPLVYVVVTPINNPDCPAVRDRFLDLHPAARYEEIVVANRTGGAGRTSTHGFQEAARRFGDRHLSGIRRDESGGREMRFRRWGLETDRTLAPLGNWSARDVFAYLTARSLPIHPAYAMSFGGAIPRDHLRVSSLGGVRGRGTGRQEWERAYYPEAEAWTR